MRKRRRRKWLGLAVLALAVLGPPLLFGVSNLFLASPKGRAFVSGRIQRTIQLETSVRGSSWSPWNGFTVRGLLIRQPAPLRDTLSAPLFAAESIRIHPDWRALLGRRLAIRGVEIRKPDLAVPIELLSQIPHAPAGPAVAAEPPDLALADAPPPVSAVPGSSPPAPVPPQGNAEMHVSGKPSGKTAPTVWISVSEGRLAIVSGMSKEPLYRISRIDGAIPLGGRTAVSGLSLGGIGFLGGTVAGTVRVPLEWKSPVLGAGVIEGGACGIACRLEAKIGLTPGIPFLIGGVVPQQEGREVGLTEALGARLGAVAGQGRLQGLLLAPGSWQGQGILQARGIETDYAGQKARFDQGQALVMFQGGALRCPDARLVGEEVSILGNAMLLGDGRFAGNARVVAAPETLLALAKHTQPDGSAPQLTPLGTPQRSALDMRVFGFPGKVFYQPNPAAKPIPLQ